MWLLKKVINKKSKKDKNYRSQVTIPYVGGVSEWVDQVLKKYRVTRAKGPYTTIRRLFAHPNDKVEPQEQGELIYQTLYKSCGILYRRDRDII